MANRDDLQSLRSIAKRLARAKRIAHHEALDLLAEEIGHPHWNALTSAWKGGWRLSPRQLNEVSKGAEAARTSASLKEHGIINGHPYTVKIDLKVVMYGKGWAILVEQAPSEKPRFEAYDSRADNPILDPAFVSEALVICGIAAEELRTSIAEDWPRRSTKPDAKGRTLHPLNGGLSGKWFCLHCDEVSSGSEIAANIWHCPKCSAAPIDIFSSPFWLGVESG